MESIQYESDPTRPNLRPARPIAGKAVVRASDWQGTWEEVCVVNARDRAQTDANEASIREAELRAMGSGSQIVIGRP